jgi:hypothetical protein
MTIMRGIIGHIRPRPKRKGSRRGRLGYHSPSMPLAPFPRKKRRLLIEYVDSTGERRTAFTRDFSMTGFYVLAEVMPTVGSEQEMKLHLPRGVVTIPARVVRIGRGTSAVEGSATKGFAVALSGFCDLYTKLVETL